MGIVWITPTECSPTSSDAWHDIDVSAYISGSATGVILHCISSLTDTFGLRKNGASDDRTDNLDNGYHCWAAIGVDSGGVFECYAGNKAKIELWLVGYFESEATFATNATAKTATGSNYTWHDMDCSSEAPSAEGLIFEFAASSATCNNVRCNGSTDNRVNGPQNHRAFGRIVKCDSSQVVEGYRGTADATYYLVGHITSGCTWYTNGQDYSLTTTGAWTDLPSNLPAGGTGGFFQVLSVGAHTYGLREDDTSEDIYKTVYNLGCGFVAADENGTIEGEIDSTQVDYFLDGYTAAASVDKTVYPTALAITATLQSPEPAVTKPITALSAVASVQSPEPAVTVIPLALDVDATLYDPVLVLDGVVTPTALSALATLYDPEPEVRVSPSALGIGATLHAPEPAVLISPSALAVNATLHEPTLINSPVVVVSALSIVATLHEPTPVAGIIVLLSALSIVATIHDPALKVDTVAAPSALAIAASLHDPTVAIVVSPVALAVEATLHNPEPMVMVSPSALGILADLGTPEPVVMVSPSALPITGTLRVPVAGITVTPSALSIEVTLRSPNISISGEGPPYIARRRVRKWGQFEPGPVAPSPPRPQVDSGG